MPYNNWKDVHPQQGKQQLVMDMVKKGQVDLMLMGGARSGGKAVSDHSLTLTPWGYKEACTLKVGDVIMNPDGYRQKIIGINPFPNWDYYRVTMKDGGVIEVSPEHLWISWKGDKLTKKQRRWNKEHPGENWWDRDLYPVQAECVTIKQMQEWMERGYNPLIPVNKAIHYETQYNKDEHIDPYLLGFLLGDGCISSERYMNYARDKEDNYIIDPLMEKLGFEIQPDSRNIGVYIKKNPARDDLAVKLKRYKLLGTKSDTKFIPEIYKKMSVDDRISLLQGLMDTDGTVTKENGKEYYYTTSKQLADDVRELVMGLGGVATAKSSKVGKYRDDNGQIIECKECWNVFIRLPDEIMPFRLQRKIDRVTKSYSPMYRTVESIEYVGKQDMRCFSVSNPNRLFISDDYIVTHNSELITMAPLYFIDDPSFRAIFFRRENGDLFGANSLWEKAENIYPLFGGKPNQTAKRWQFPSGARVFYNHMFMEQDKENHRGKGYSAVFFDEIDQFTPTQVQFLQTCLRSEADVDSFMIGTLNPNPDSWCLPLVEYYLNEDGSPNEDRFGDIRHFIVKDGEFIFGPDEQWFKDNHPDSLWITIPDKINGGSRTMYVPPKRFTYCFFNIFDNPAAMNANPRYVSELQNLPTHERDTQLFGNWYSRPRGGKYFDSKWLKVVDRLPLEAHFCRAYDLAAKERSEVDRYPDPTSSVKMYKDSDGFFYIAGDYHEQFYDPVDQVYGNMYERVGARDKIIRKQAIMDSKDCVMVFPVDPGQAGIAAYQSIAKKFGSYGFRVKRDPIPTNKDKLTKFLPFADAAENGLVRIVKSSFDDKSYKYLIRQLEAFTGERSTATRHDDLVDAVSMCYNYLVREIRYEPYKVPQGITNNITRPNSLSRLNRDLGNKNGLTPPTKIRNDVSETRNKRSSRRLIGINPFSR